ncbi:NADPH-dependent FMN reductase [Halothece sp. PCC 7418]|uniref:NADPH-dependent FMN reductase n=1 Tax=Halothece sp. (strain PCC 7418) TaxID=65093 RepID=UPI0002A06AF3|nr:NAD(P)H-dependent oxidoreductase [Halothece sp. PCC 7418]AFZ43672.1 NADPH-dependent FMN reductase [Halothece sp. PCC 7418]
MSYLIIGASLHPKSHSQVLAEQAQQLLQAQGKEAEWLDLREISLPFCDGSTAYSDPSIPPLAETVAQAEGILVATPIYNYDVNAAIKNFLELTGKSWQEKTVGFLCAAGGQGSYMSVMPFANSLMLDFRCLIIPRFVYATGDAFVEGRLVDETIKTRLAELVDQLVEITSAFKSH